jgi:hypothetical protein
MTRTIEQQYDMTELEAERYAIYIWDAGMTQEEALDKIIDGRV